VSLYKANDRRDGNEPEIVECLRAMGASVAQISGRDVPDLAIGWRGSTYLAEVKQPKAQLRPGQEKFSREWKGHPVAVLRTPGEAAVWLLSLAPCIARVAEAVDLVSATKVPKIRVDEMEGP